MCKELQKFAAPVNRQLRHSLRDSPPVRCNLLEWDVTEEYPVDSCPVVQVCADVIAPVALSGQYLLLDWEDREPTNGDLVVVESPDKKKYVRRQVHQLPLGPEAKVRHWDF